MGGGQNSQKISAPLHLIKIYQMRLLLAWSISLDSTFKQKEAIRVINLAGCRDHTKPLFQLSWSFNPGWKFMHNCQLHSFEVAIFLQWSLKGRGAFSVEAMNVH